MVESNESVEALRSKHRVNRAALDTHTQQTNAVALLTQLETLPEYQSARHVAAYIAIRGEIDLAAVIDKSKVQGKQFYLPILKGETMFFAPWLPDMSLVKKGFGLLEPDAEPASFIEPRQLDLVLAPLVVFDDQCNRIGQGGGFYDRTFAYKKQSKEGVAPVLMGVAHESQREQQLQPQHWDVPLDFVVTDQQVYQRGMRN